MRKLSRFLELLGRPIFTLLITVIAFAGFSSLFLLRLLHLIKVHRIAMPRVKFPRFMFPKVHFNFRPLLPFLIIFPITLFLLIFYFQILKDLPSPLLLINHEQQLTTQILDRNGNLLYKIYQDENRTPVKLDRLPSFVKDAFIAIEDKDFYHHHGISFTGMIRALLSNIKCQITGGSCTLEGGSTITQQLVKNVLLNNEKTWQRKVKEVILAFETESLLSKADILQMYLNEVGFGGTAYGIEEASQQYFGIHAVDINLAQASFLAGLPKSPTRFSPYGNPEDSLNRQHLVLKLMLENHFITDSQFAQAANTTLSFSPKTTNISAPHFVMYIRDLLASRFGQGLLYHGGFKVTTSLDLNIQHTAESILREEIGKIKSLHVGNGAILITAPSSGQILAMVGSTNFFDTQNDGQVNLTNSLRQPGSAIKPVNYALAFENGLTPDTVIKDEPISFKIPGVGLWTPQNYDGRFHGDVTLRQALANSYNIPAILLLQQNGVDNMINLGQKMGITTWNEKARYGLALTLGSAEVTMTDMSVVYGTFANKGITVPLNPILKIEDQNGHEIEFNSPSPVRSIKPASAYMISDILSDRNARAAAFGYNSILNLKNFTAAVKTGTSNDLRDNWTIGYTPDFVVTVWVGNNDNSPMSHIASGITGASPIWSKMMTDLLSHNSQNTAFTPPDGFIKQAAVPPVSSSN